MLAIFRRFLLLVAALLLALPASAQSPTPVGVWMHPNERIKVEIAPCDDVLCGKIVWLSRPDDSEGLPRVDSLNADPALRTRFLWALTVLHDLRAASKRTWDGKIYNPDDGRDYSAILSIQDDGSLRMRAYVLLPLLGRTLIWKRVG